MTQKTNKIIAFVEFSRSSKWIRGWVMHAEGNWAEEMLGTFGAELSEWPIGDKPWKSRVIAVWEGDYATEAVGAWRAPTVNELISLTV